MINIEKLLTISSEPLAPRPTGMPQCLGQYLLGADLFQMLLQKNGFYAFESALHVFPLTEDVNGGLETWNADSLWRDGYKDLAEGLLFFAEDIFQDQFCLSKKHDGVYRFSAETGQIGLMAGSIEEWAALILSGYESETGWPFAHDWQAKHGPLPPGKRLLPKTPFFVGGDFDIENFWAGDAVEGMRFKADLATHTHDLPDGARVRLIVRPKRTAT